MKAANLNSVKRTTQSVSAVLSWPDKRCDWESLPSPLRNAIRENLDAACDLLARYREARQL